MNKKLIPLIVIAGAGFLSACNTENSTNSSTTPSVSKEDAIASVNGKYISKNSLTQLEQEINQRSPNHSFPKEKLIDELIQRELLIQEAVNKQLDKSAEYTERLETIKNSLLSQAAIQNYAKSNPVSDAEIEAEYNKNITAAGTEYSARHILVKTEEEAKQIITELTAGADFIELAKTKSTGPSGPQGGDLGWFSATQMVAPFSEAAIALEDGKFTTAPVQTQFGWHIILKQGSRALTPPPLASVKEQIRPMLQRQKMQAFMDDLRTQAKVEILLPAATETKEIASQAESTIDNKTTVEAVSEKATETVESAIETVKTEVESAATEATEEINKKASEIATEVKDKASESATKALEAVTK